ncbi:MAG: bifunctional demethylmenaquinone methyltransferase/2-methoxy-6-polyprenyl-1,4-benzoquinol methylase UbiE [Nitratireductor sp.]
MVDSAPNSTNRTTKPEEMAASYGFKKVGIGEKQPLVNDVFHKVAERYDVMNDFMSAGMHRVWKDAMVAKLNPPKNPNANWRSLDMAGGTGDIAFRIINASNKTAHTTVSDINASMLQVGEKRANDNGLIDNTSFVEANAEELPFESNSFDAYTIAFGIRNVPRMDKALSEAHRVLKRGGRFLCLEFSEVEMPMLDKFYDQWSMHAIPQIGKMVTGEAEPYQYLVESIRKFPDQISFANLITQAGFAQVSYTNYTGGIAALHSGWKL